MAGHAIFCEHVGVEAFLGPAAYGGLVGRRFPDAALRDLYCIVQAEDVRLLKVLSYSVTNLFQAGNLAPDYYLKVLDALAVWIDDSQTNIVALTSLLIFLELALVSKVEVAPEGGTWPTLLWLMQEDETYRDRVVFLWRRALNVKSARNSALETLRQCLLIVDQDTRLYSSAEQLIVTLATRGAQREQDRLRFYLKQWTSYAKKATCSAAKILSVLNDLERR